VIDFTCTMHSPRVVFAAGSLARLGEEIDRLGRRALVLATPSKAHLAGRIRTYAGTRLAGTYYRAAAHVPRSVADAAIAHARTLGIDCCVALGGGSTIGLAKAVALELPVPIIAVPTTFSGSEMTPIWDISDRGAKTTGRDQRVLPSTVLYDPELALSLPPRLVAASGLNAIAHCVEALYAIDLNPVTSLIAEEGIRTLADALPAILSAPKDPDARARALYGAWLAGSCLGTVSMGLHHQLCHTLGGDFGLPHAETHAVLIPHVMAFNAAAAPEAAARIARALGARDAAEGLWQLGRRLGAPAELGRLGLRESDIEKAAAIAAARFFANPRLAGRDSIAALLAQAAGGPIGRRQIAGPKG
jgi:maleylacetate reductase